MIPLSLILLATLLHSCLGQRKDELAFLQVDFQGDMGWIIGWESFLTRDGGKSWQRSELTYRGDPESNPLQVRPIFQFLAGGIGFYLRDGLHRSVDGGRTWTQVAADKIVWNIHFIDARVGFATRLGERKIYRTADGGLTWQPTSLVDLDSVVMMKETAYATLGTRLYRSEDLGVSWNLIQRFEEAIWDLTVERDTLWMVGSGGTCLQYDTSAGIIEDFSIPIENKLHRPGPDLHDFGLYDGKKFAVGTGPIVYVSELHSKEWQAHQVASHGSLTSIAFAPDGTAFAVGGSQTSLFPSLTDPSRIAVSSKDYINWKKFQLP